MSLTRGCIVHYHTHLGFTLAALVTWINEDGSVNLTTFASLGATEGRVGVQQGDNPGCWNWPPRN